MSSVARQPPKAVAAEPSPAVPRYRPSTKTRCDELRWSSETPKDKAFHSHSTTAFYSSVALPRQAANRGKSIWGGLAGMPVRCGGAPNRSLTCKS